MKIRTYSEMKRFRTFEERFDYLSFKDSVGRETFGSKRYINQIFYKDQEWLRVRREVILRDNACDLGCSDRPILDDEQIVVHHINPITEQDIVNRNPKVFDLNNLITTTSRTHRFIHYGNGTWDKDSIIERKPFDTIPWR